jgi:hypothetical protein
MTENTSGLNPGFIAVGAAGDADLRFIVLTQAQMDEVDVAAASGNYTDAVNEIVDRHKLYQAEAVHGTIKEALAHMASQGLLLEDDFSFSDY